MKKEEDIIKDRQERVAKCKDEIETILGKYQLALTAEDMIGEKTKIAIQLSFMDLKKHDTDKAQTTAEIVSDLLDPKGDKI